MSSLCRTNNVADLCEWMLLTHCNQLFWLSYFMKRHHSILINILSVQWCDALQIQVPMRNWSDKFNILFWWGFHSANTEYSCVSWKHYSYNFRHHALINSLLSLPNDDYMKHLCSYLTTFRQTNLCFVFSSLVLDNVIVNVV